MMQFVNKYAVFRLISHPNISNLSFRRINITHSRFTSTNDSYLSNSKNDKIVNIRALLDNLENSGILESKLYKEIQKHIQQCSKSTSNTDDIIIAAVYNDLLPLADMKTYFQNNNDHKVICLSKDILQNMKHHDYSIIELLIKLKLIYSHLLTDASLNRHSEVSFEEQIKSPESEQEDFLNELMIAPLHDIGVFLEQNRENFDKYYKIDIIKDLAYRISHSTENASTNPQDMIDKLCKYINNSLAKKYSPLKPIEIITYIEDQYHSEETLKYRCLLQKFITTNRGKLIFNDFYQAARIHPVFLSELKKTI
ncbi:hypothetical protein I4U23_015695 [Adineta vaga]|nr:hypothetical protein I4U23_015695 [Adineta vaga]